MIKQRIRKIENLIIHSKKGYKSWMIIAPSTQNAKEQINTIKAGEIHHPEGGFYSDQDRNEFAIFIMSRPC